MMKRRMVLQQALSNAICADPVHSLAIDLACLGSRQTLRVWLAQAGANGLGHAVHASSLECSQKNGAPVPDIDAASEAVRAIAQVRAPGPP